MKLLLKTVTSLKPLTARTKRKNFIFTAWKLCDNSVTLWCWTEKVTDTALLTSPSMSGCSWLESDKMSFASLLIGVARGGPKGPCLSKFSKNMVILCFERRFSKQNRVIRLKWNILALPIFCPPQVFGLAAPLSLLLDLERNTQQCLVVRNLFLCAEMSLFYVRGGSMLLRSFSGILHGSILG